jgi:hypothetical protein
MWPWRRTTTACTTCCRCPSTRCGRVRLRRAGRARVCAYVHPSMRIGVRLRLFARRSCAHGVMLARVCPCFAGPCDCHHSTDPQMTEDRDRDRRLFTWPAEASDDLVRDTVMMAGRFVAEGSWRAALDAVNGLRVWSVLPSCDRDRCVPASLSRRTAHCARSPIAGHSYGTAHVARVHRASAHARLRETGAALHLVTVVLCYLLCSHGVVWWTVCLRCACALFVRCGVHAGWPR